MFRSMFRFMSVFVEIYALLIMVMCISCLCVYKCIDLYILWVTWTSICMSVRLSICLCVSVLACVLVSTSV